MGEARRTYDLDLARAARTTSLSSLESSSEELGGRGVRLGRKPPTFAVQKLKQMECPTQNVFET